MSTSIREKKIVLNAPGLGRGPAARGSGPGTTGGKRIYLLSPADAGGKRAQMLCNPGASFELACRLRSTGVPLGEAFSFMSALYFRGKLLYASTFGNAPEGLPSYLVITPCRGLLRPETVVRRNDLMEISDERVDLKNPKYRDALEGDLRALSEAIGRGANVVLLGSLATKKYLPPLMNALGERLLVPREFVGMGDMQRGALLLRCARESRELTYVSVTEAGLALD